MASFNHPSAGRLWDDHTMMGHQSIANQDFGTGVRSPGGRTIYQQQSSYYNQQASLGGETIASKFRVCLDVRQFTAHELEVKTTEQFVTVHGKHDEKQDEFGLISREFTRRYPLPDDVDPETVTSSLTTDGILVIQAPKKSS